MSNGLPYQEIFYSGVDGLRLFARFYEAVGEVSLTPVLCLPGLTRNSRDFEPVVDLLAKGRSVIMADFRGRGRSDYADDAQSYRVDVEMQDMLCLLKHLQIDRCGIIGTSRGGLVGMLLAATEPGLVAGLLLNDIGPAVEKNGLLRIRHYLGQPLAAKNWQDAAIQLQLGSSGFDNMSPAEWHAFARRIYRDAHGVPALDYDVGLAATFPTVEQLENGDMADLWPLYTHLPHMSLAVIHGENSDLLSVATLEIMQQQRHDLKVTHVPHRGHAPFLNEPMAREAITMWLEQLDVTPRARGD